MRRRLLSLAELVILLAATLSVCSCATKPTQSASAVTTPDAATAATLRFYRHRVGGSDALWHNYVYLDGVKIGRLNTDESFEVKAAPGVRELTIVPEAKGLGATGSAKHTLTIDVKPNEIYYVRYGTRLGPDRKSVV